MIEDALIVCRCRHLTNFAVLVSMRHTNDFMINAADSRDAENLRVITLVGCSSSAVALFVSLIFFVSQINPSDRIKINCHFCFNLLCAMILVLCGLSDDLGELNFDLCNSRGASQFNQIGQFLKVLSSKFLYKGTPNIK